MTADRQAPAPRSAGMPLMERAYELATSQRFATVAEVEQALRQEGYSTFGELAGQDIRRRLKAACEGRTYVAPKTATRPARKQTRPRVID